MIGGTQTLAKYERARKVARPSPFREFYGRELTIAPASATTVTAASAPSPSAASAAVTTPSAASAPTSVAATSATTASAFTLGTRLIDDEGAAKKVLAVERFYRFVRFGVVADFGKTESAWLPCKTIAQ